jgi:hypothetical protein
VPEELGHELNTDTLAGGGNFRLRTDIAELRRARGEA